MCIGHTSETELVT